MGFRYQLVTHSAPPNASASPSTAGCCALVVRPKGLARTNLVLNSRARGFIAGPNKEHRMLALYIILGFVAVLAAINFIEFGRVD